MARKKKKPNASAEKHAKYRAVVGVLARSVNGLNCFAGKRNYFELFNKFALARGDLILSAYFTHVSYIVHGHEVRLHL